VLTMKHKVSKKVKIVISSILAVLLLAGGIAYAAADRFLIENVEATVAVSKDTSNDSNSEADSDSSSYTATDTSYSSDDKTITITKVTTGSGDSLLTYYVADVVLTDGTDLKSALAKNEYGTNITQYVSQMATNNNAILAINGDYYGFRSDGIMIRDGVIYRDDPAREGLAIYSDGTMKVYDETSTSAEQLLEDGVYNTLSFGPALLDNGEIVSGIDSAEVDTNFGNHSIQGNQPRTGIGIISQNHFVFVVADGRNEGYSNGVTLTDFAQIFKDLGCTTAYNLDGGGSSEMVFMGNIVNTPSNSNGSERGTSDILYIS
jgi:exopolysaccharide biosynthesis protein